MSNLIEGHYDDLDHLKDDLDSIVNNCSTYWSRDGFVAQGEPLIKAAMSLQDAFLRSLRNSENEVNKGGKNAGALSLMPRLAKLLPVQASASSSKPIAKNKDKGPAAVLAAAPIVPAPAPPAAAPTMSLKLKRQSSASENAPTAAAEASHAHATVTAAPPTSAAAIAALDRKIDKYLRAAFKLSLDGIKNHYLVGTHNGVSFTVPTARPFLRAVDPLTFPDYASIITDPIDINKIEKRLNTDRYGSVGASGGSAELAVSAIIKDMTLLRDNAHTYNTGAENVEVRIMADCLLHYFKYILRECLKYVKQQTGSKGTLVYVSLLLFVCIYQRVYRFARILSPNIVRCESQIQTF